MNSQQYLKLRNSEIDRHKKAMDKLKSDHMIFNSTIKIGHTIRYASTILVDEITTYESEHFGLTLVYHGPRISVKMKPYKSGSRDSIAYKPSVQILSRAGEK